MVTRKLNLNDINVTLDSHSGHVSRPFREFDEVHRPPESPKSDWVSKIDFTFFLLPRGSQEPMQRGMKGRSLVYPLQLAQWQTNTALIFYNKSLKTYPLT